MIIGFGPESPADIGAGLVQAPLGRAMGMTAVQEYIGGEGGALAALEIIRSGPDRRALLVADPFTLCLLAAAKGRSLLAMANNDRMSTYLSAKDLMQKRAGLTFQPFVAGSAQAILDRVLHHAITINIRGHSYRLKEKLKAGLVRLEETAATT